MVRFKNRWLLVEFISCHEHPSPSTDLLSKHIWQALRDSVIKNFGEVGWGAVASSMNIKYFSPTTSLCIIRVSRDYHNIAWGAVTLLTSIEGRDYIPRLVHLSGTIKHAQSAAIKYDREIIARFRARLLEKGQRSDNFDDYLQRSEKEIQAMQDCRIKLRNSVVQFRTLLQLDFPFD